MLKRMSNRLRSARNGLHVQPKAPICRANAVHPSLDHGLSNWHWGPCSSKHLNASRLFGSALQHSFGYPKSLDNSKDVLSTSKAKPTSKRRTASPVIEPPFAVSANPVPDTIALHQLPAELSRFLYQREEQTQAVGRPKTFPHQRTPVHATAQMKVPSPQRLQQAFCNRRFAQHADGTYPHRHAASHT